MRKIPILIILTLILIPIGKADTFNPQEIGYIEASINLTSFIGSTGKLNEINHSIYVVPEKYSNLKVIGKGDLTYKIGKDSYGNKKLEIAWKNFESQYYSITMNIKNYAKFNYTVTICLRR